MSRGPLLAVLTDTARKTGRSMPTRFPSLLPISSVAAAAIALGCTTTLEGPSDERDGRRPGASKGSGGTAAGTAGASGSGSGAGGSGAGAGEGSGGSGPGTGGAGGADEPAGPTRPGYARLTRAEYRATIELAFGVEPDMSLVPVDGRVGPFTSNGSVSPDPVHPYLLAGEDFAASVVPAELPVCTASDAAACVSDDYRASLERLFRRALADSELERWAALVTDLQAANVSAENASRALVSAALVNPDFLFRALPLGGDEARARSLAEHLGYALWDAPPDFDVDELSARPPAEHAALLGTEAARMARDSRAVPIIARFVGQWLHVDTDLRLSDGTFESSPLYLELLALVEHALATDVPVTALVAAPRSFVHEDNLDAYGIDDAPSADAVSLVTWPAEAARRGVLGQELFADSTRHPDPGRRPIFRGKLVRTSLLCDSIPAPSADLLELDDEVGDRTLDPRCAGCHLMMDPVGRAFSALDADFDGSPEPAEILDHDELAGTYASLSDLLDAVAESRAFAECFARHWLAFFMEQPLGEIEPAWIAELADEVAAGASLGRIVEQSMVTLEARSRMHVPWCEGS